MDDCKEQVHLGKGERSFLYSFSWVEKREDGDVQRVVVPEAVWATQASLKEKGVLVSRERWGNASLSSF